MKVQADKDNANLRVEDGVIANGDFLVILRVDIATVGRVCTTDVGDILGAEFLFNAAFAEDEDFALVWRKLEDARDVY